jgi:hypothetical protein
LEAIPKLVRPYLKNKQKNRVEEYLKWYNTYKAQDSILSSRQRGERGVCPV